MTCSMGRDKAVVAVKVARIVVVRLVAAAMAAMVPPVSGAKNTFPMAALMAAMAGGVVAVGVLLHRHGVQRLVHISGIGADNRGSNNRFIRSKVAAEDAIIKGFDGATILRPSVVFGDGDAMFNRLGEIAAKAPDVWVATRLQIAQHVLGR